MFKPTNLPGVFLYWYSSVTPLTQAQVQHSVIVEIQGLQKATGGNTTMPQPLAFSPDSVR